MLGVSDASVLDRVAEDVFDGPIVPDLLREFLNDPRHHLAAAIEEGAVIGIASAIDYIHPDKRAQCWINEVSVAPAHRRRGIGTLLVRAITGHARVIGCEVVWLATEIDNEPARALYRAAGAVETPIVMYDFPLD
jgi:ribosomal protein S18 acetylase RimI-like enzyme